MKLPWIPRKKLTESIKVTSHAVFMKDGNILLAHIKQRVFMIETNKGKLVKLCGATLF